MSKLTFLFLFFPHALSAQDWVCREASSLRSGNVILSCGVATNENLDMARSESLKNSKKEFFSVCESSVDCRDFEYVVIPKRTECTTNNGLHTCYRAIEFQITNLRKRDITVDINAVENQIKEKQAELKSLKHKLEQQESLNQINEEIELTKMKLETDVDTLKDRIDKFSVEEREYSYSELDKSNSFGLHLFSSSFSEFSNTSSVVGIGARFEKRFLQNLGIQLDLNFGSNFKEESPNNTGASNTSSSFRGFTKSNEALIGLPLYWNYRAYIKPSIGRMWLERTDKNVSYGPLGTKTTSTEIKDSRVDSFYGLALGYITAPVDSKGSKYYFELGIRCVSSCSNPNFHGLMGLQLGF